jgi:hypothetical protein
MRIKNRKNDKTFAAQKLMGPDHHRVFMYASDLSVSNQKEGPQQEPVISGDPTD